MARPLSNEERADGQAKYEDACRYVEALIDCMARKYGVIVTHRAIRDSEKYAATKRTDKELERASYDAFGL